MTDRGPSVGDQLAAHLRAGTLWLPNWSSTLCELGIFVDQSPESIATSDAKLGRRCRGWKRLQRRCLVECSVRPMGVEVRYVLGQHNLKLAPVKDQHPIQQQVDHRGLRVSPSECQLPLRGSVTRSTVPARANRALARRSYRCAPMSGERRAASCT